MTLGEKIKFIRSFRNMTQGELGTTIGLPTRGADNRIAQYETNYRVPKRNMLIDMAYALNVDPLVFIPDYYGYPQEILQSLFWLDTEYGDILTLFPVEPGKKKYNTGHEIRGEYDDNDDMSSLSMVGLLINHEEIQDLLHEWMIRKQEFNAGEISKDEYLEWKLGWPDTCSEKGPIHKPCKPKHKWKK